MLLGHKEADCPFLTPEQYAKKEEKIPLFTVELGDANFTSITKIPDTFAGWFILFYKASEPSRLEGMNLFNRAAIDMGGDISMRLAQVDIEANPMLKRVFSLREQKKPIIVFVHQNSFFEYRGDRDVRSMITFGLSGFQSLYGSVKQKPLPFSRQQNEM